MGDSDTTTASLMAELAALRAEVAVLREQAATWQTAQRIAHLGSWQFDCLTQTTTWSEGTYRIHGHDPSLSVPQGEDLEQYIHPDDWEKYQQLFKMAEAGQRFEVDLRIIRPDGEVRYIEARGEPGVFDEQGRLLRIFGTVLDVTDRKHTEEALRRSEFALREAQKVAHVGHWRFNGEDQQLVWSEEVFRIHGLEYQNGILSPKDNSRYIHPDDLKIQRAMSEAILQGEAYEADLRIIRPDGEIRHLEVRCPPGMRNSRGEVVEAFGTILDITERKCIEEKLRHSEAEMQAVLKAMPDMLIRVSKDGRRLFISPGTLKPYANLERLPEKTIYETLPVDLARQRMEYVQRAIETRERQVYEYEIPIQGDLRHEEARIVAINDSEVLIIVRDITEKRQFEQVKDEFISMVSHELRTPLTSIQVALSLLDDDLVDPQSEDGQAMIHMATTGVDRLVRLVNDILDLERLELGKLQMQMQICQSDTLIQQAIQQMQDLAKQSNIVMTASGESYELWADCDRILQVITNLLSNAIRFSHSGGHVWVDVQKLGGDGVMASGSGGVLPSPHPPNTLLFSVTDQGRGIPAGKLESIFERFQQANASDSREKSGTGLGLTICKEIVQQHGGQIWVDSIIGQGSTFYFTLPIGVDSRYG